jgi:hypothetical protein
LVNKYRLGTLGFAYFAKGSTYGAIKFNPIKLIIPCILPSVMRNSTILSDFFSSVLVGDEGG